MKKYIFLRAHSRVLLFTNLILISGISTHLFSSQPPPGPLSPASKKDDGSGLGPLSPRATTEEKGKDKIDELAAALKKEEEGEKKLLVDPKKDPKIREAIVRASLFDYTYQSLLDIDQKFLLICAYKNALESEKRTDPTNSSLDSEYEKCCNQYQEFLAYPAQQAEKWKKNKLKTIWDRMSDPDDARLRFEYLVNAHIYDLQNGSLEQIGTDSKSPVVQKIPVPLKPIIDRKNKAKGFGAIIGGIDPVLQDLVDALKNDDDFEKFDLPLPRGILLVGPPGIGKTAVVRAISQEVDSHFMPLSGGSFIDKYIGSGPAKIRELFDEARREARKLKNGRLRKTIMFIDEADGLSKRDDKNHIEYDNALREFLTQMDGCIQDNDVVVIGATNNSEAMDPALLRDGRFSLVITMQPPNLQKRIALLEFFNAARPVHASVDYEAIAKILEGHSIADIKGLCFVTAQIARRTKSECLTLEHFNQGLKQFFEMEVNKRKNCLKKNG